jgi:hypothetical protein
MGCSGRQVSAAKAMNKRLSGYIRQLMIVYNVSEVSREFSLTTSGCLKAWDFWVISSIEEK